MDRDFVMAKKIVVVGGNTLFSGGYAYADALAEGFRALGQKTTLLTFEQEAYALQQLAEAVSSPTQFVVSLNGVATCPYFEGRSLVELLNAPAVSLFVDDPLQSGLRPRLEQKGQLMTFVDPQLVELVVQRLGVESTWAHYCPLAACQLPQESRTLDSTPERPIDLFFCGNYKDPKGIRSKWEGLERRQIELLEEICELGLSQGQLPLWQVWLESSQYHRLSPLDQHLTEFHLLPMAETYVRFERRNRVVSLLAEQGVKIHLAGGGWRDHPSVHLHHYLGELPLEETVRLYSKCKVALHMSPAFFADSHERPLIAMTQGCAVIADLNRFWAEEFEIGRHLEVFRWDDLERLPQQLNTLLSDVPRLQQMGRKAGELVLQRHTWNVRAKQILSLAQRLFS